VFLDRHTKVDSGGCCYYNGYHYQLKAGQAHAAPPGRSFHEDVVHGYAAAVDAIGDLKWAALHCEEYGLEQATWGGEVWHFQFTEFPHSVSSWIKVGSPQPTKWVLPGTEPQPGDGDMTPDQANQLDQVHTIMAGAFWPNRPDITNVMNGELATRIRHIEDKLDKLIDKLA